MHIVSAVLQLYLPSRSLKEKRSIIKSLLARSRNRFNVAAAEVEFQDVHDTAALGFVTVSENRAGGRRVLEEIVAWVEEERPDLEITSVDIEER